MDRDIFIEKLRSKLPMRLHMSILFLMTAASGVLVDLGLLRSGLGSPALRYGLAVTAAYGVFFALVKLWAEYVLRPPSKTDFGPSDLLIDGPSDQAIDAAYRAARWEGASGRFSGAGASGSWGDANADAPSGTSLGDVDVDADAGLVVFFGIALLAVILGGATYVIVQAPEILMEAAFEVALAAGLVRSARRIEGEGWHVAIFRRTWVVFAFTLMLAVAFGYFVKRGCPEAQTVAQYRDLCWSRP